jgi:hypothetical protein
VHPETKRLLEEKGKKIQFDPVVAESEMRSYKTEFLDKRPLGDKTEVTSKIKNVSRVRTRDRRNEFLVWTEVQTFLDEFGIEVSFTRNYCGMYKIPKWKPRSVANERGGVKTEWDVVGWITLYEVPYTWENAKKMKEMAEDELHLQTYIETQDDEEVWTIKPDDFQKWAKWSYESLLEYCRFPQKFAKPLDPVTGTVPKATKNELFPDQNKNKKTEDNQAPEVKVK